MPTTLHNISIEGVAPSTLEKKKSELYSLQLDFESVELDEGYRFHGVTVERMGMPNVIIRTFDNAGNALGSVSVTLDGTTIGVSNDDGYLYYRQNSALTNVTLAASVTSYTSESVKVSFKEGGSIMQSFYLTPSSGEATTKDRIVIKTGVDKIITRTKASGSYSFATTTKSALASSGTFSDSSKTEQHIYDAFKTLTQGSPAAGRVAVRTAGTTRDPYAYVRRYVDAGTGKRKYQKVLRSATSTTDTVAGSTLTERQAYDYFVELMTGTNPGD